jgi:hypothetical protein
LFLATWLGAATLFAGSGLFGRMPPYFIPILIWTQVLMIAVVLWRSAGARGAVALVPVWVMVAFHGVRAPIGAAFLVFEARGLLAPEFAWSAGIGDLLVGVLAVPVAIAVRRQPAEWRGRIRVWNWFGLLDILLVFMTAQRILLFGEGPSALRAFFLFPVQLVPLYVVPLVLLTHALIHLRLKKPRV